MRSYDDIQDIPILTANMMLLKCNKTHYRFPDSLWDLKNTKFGLQQKEQVKKSIIHRLMAYPFLY